MESFGLFNFLKSVLSPPAAAPRGEGAEKEPESAASLLQNLLSPPSTDERTGETAPADTPPPTAADAAEESNPFLTLMERHDRMSKSIARKAPKK